MTTFSGFSDADFGGHLASLLVDDDGDGGFLGRPSFFGAKPPPRRVGHALPSNAALFAMSPPKNPAIRPNAGIRPTAMRPLQDRMANTSGHRLGSSSKGAGRVDVAVAPRNIHDQLVLADLDEDQDDEIVVALPKKTVVETPKKVSFVPAKPWKRRAPAASVASPAKESILALSSPPVTIKAPVHQEEVSPVVPQAMPTIRPMVLTVVDEKRDVADVVTDVFADVADEQTDVEEVKTHDHHVQPVQPVASTPQKQMSIPSTPQSAAASLRARSAAIDAGSPALPRAMLEARVIELEKELVAEKKARLALEERFLALEQHVLSRK